MTSMAGDHLSRQPWSAGQSMGLNSHFKMPPRSCHAPGSWRPTEWLIFKYRQPDFLRATLPGREGALSSRGPTWPLLSPHWFQEHRPVGHARGVGRSSAPGGEADTALASSLPARRSSGRALLGCLRGLSSLGPHLCAAATGRGQGGLSDSKLQPLSLCKAGMADPASLGSPVGGASSGHTPKPHLLSLCAWGTQYNDLEPNEP